jgi:hypothetical protein
MGAIPLDEAINAERKPMILLIRENGGDVTTMRLSGYNVP